MITIDINTGKFRVAVTGHAMPEETDEYREVCAGISAMAQGLMYCMTKYESDHDALVSVNYRSDPGDLLIEVTPNTWAESAMRKRIRNYADGLELLAMEHPESVTMIIDGETVKPMEGGKQNE